MMTSDDPWSDLEPPVASDIVNARRVDGKLRWGFFWAKSVDRRCLLILQHDPASSSNAPLPRLRGIEVSESDPEDGGARMLSLKLVEAQHRDIFLTLCKDIVSASSIAEAEAEAVATFLARTWRWHHLLRGGGDGRLSAEEQKGLIGELLLLKNTLAPDIGIRDAVKAWRGPTGAPKDFEVGRICVEVKARRGAARPFVAISSEDQLDPGGTDALYLYVVELDIAPDNVSTAFTLTDIARQVRDMVNSDHAVIEIFEQILAASGFLWDDDYSDSRWIAGPHRLFLVGDGFPSVTRAKAGPGVSRIRYEVALPECDPFRADDTELTTSLKGAANGD